MNSKEMYKDMVEEALRLVDLTDVSDSYSNMDIELGTTILQKERTKRSLQNTHQNMLNEIQKINKNNKELSNSINECKKEISEIFM
jgi:peptidoglycan hydrolase CwlO-like protein